MWGSELVAQLCDSTELSDTGLGGEQQDSRLADGCTEAGVECLVPALSSELPWVALDGAFCCIASPHSVVTQ